MKRHAVPRWGYNTAQYEGREVGICRRKVHAANRVREFRQVRNACLDFGLLFKRLGSCLQWLLPGTWDLVVGDGVVRLRR